VIPHKNETWINRKMKEKQNLRSIRGKMKMQRIMSDTIRGEFAVHRWMEIKN
jgi:hypothetical protein